MPNATWKSHPPFNNYSNPVDWSTGVVPGLADTASFGNSSVHKLIFTATTQVGSWTFTKHASNYTFTIADQGPDVTFYGAGIVAKGGSVHISNSQNLRFANSSGAGSAKIVILPGGDAGGILIFDNQSNAGHASITNFSNLSFQENGFAASAHITNNAVLFFSQTSSAGNAVITTGSGGTTTVQGQSDGGNARFITKAGGIVDFSSAQGPGGLHLLNAGSIEGAGTYHLGSNDLTVGSNNRSTTVSGLIDGNGGTLEKAGRGTLKLSHANNTLSDGVVILSGTLDIAAIGAAGDVITFATGSELHRGTLKVENAALSNHQFTTEIELFFTDDKLLLPGLKFKPHAKATYDSDLGVLTVKSGHVTDTFTQFFNAEDDHYKAVSDGHGGTKVVVVAAQEKSVAEHGDSLQFKSLPAKHGEDLSQDASHHAAGATLGLDHALNEAIAFYNIDASHNAHGLASGAGDFGL